AVDTRLGHDVPRAVAAGMKRFSIFLLGATLASGCVRAHAKAAPDNPPLDMPAPPPRVVESSDENPPVPVELPAEPARSTIRHPTPPPQTRTDSPRPESKPETPPPEPAKPPAVEEPVPPPSPLQTTPAGDVGELEKTIRPAILPVHREAKSWPPHLPPLLFTLNPAVVTR